MSKGISTLAIIALAQLVALFLIHNRIGAVERDLATVMSSQNVRAHRYQPANAGTPAQPDQILAVPAEDRMRQIIREELHAELRHVSMAGQQPDPSVVTVPADAAEMASRRELVSEQINYFLSIGRISDAEMQDLQLNIAKLDAAGRTAALGELSRAVNSGRLEGRL